MRLLQTNSMQRLPDEQVKRSLDALLSSQQVCSMATVTLGGKPHINTLFYCYTNDYLLYVLTPPSSRHGQNLAHNPNVALSINHSQQEWDGLKQGLQLFGAAKVCELADVGVALDFYTKRFPGLGQWISRPEEIAKIDSRFYRVTIEQMKLYDEVAFGQEVHIDLKVERDT